MYLGIDLGTSSVKTVMMDEAFKTLASASADFIVSNPQPLWSEQDPAQWWNGTCAAMQELKLKYPQLLAQVKAIGLSGQQHGATLLDKHNNVLRPAILWNDGRSMTQSQELERRLPAVQKISCNRVMPGFTAPKLLWVAEHEPDIFKQVAKVLLPKDYLRLLINGEFASDMSDASGTAWLDVAKRKWSEEVLAACDLNLSHMPAVFEGCENTGRVLPEVAKLWGIPATTIVAAGAGDNAAGAISVNVTEPGDAFLSLGTSGVYFVASDKPQANPEQGVHTFAHCIPHRWHQMNCHLSAASCLTWSAGLLKANVEDLINEAEQKFAKEKTGLLFLPYLTGERSPHNNPYATGVLVGLTPNTHRAEVMQAVLEGVAFNFAEGQEALYAAGVKVNSVSVVGGGARSLYWGKILASSLQQDLSYRKDREVGSALGAARLAWLAINGGDPATVFPLSPVEKVIKPDLQLSVFYAERLKAFKRTYKALFS